MKPCISPLSIRDPKGRSAKDRITVPCGKCIYCLQKKRSDWTTRIQEELKQADSAWFITLTYNEEHLPVSEKLISQLSKQDCQLFMKRLRKQTNVKVREYQKKEIVDSRCFKMPPVRYFMVGEYGLDTMRPHYHAIVFNIPRIVMEELDKVWGKGHVQVGTVTQASIHYVTKYVINKQRELPGDRVPEFSLMSRKPGLGTSYIERMDKYHRKTKNFYVRQDGNTFSMPRFYRDKIFSDHEKQVENAKNEQNAYSRYWSEYDRLVKLGRDPFKAMDNDLEFNRQTVEARNKNKKNKL